VKQCVYLIDYLTERLGRLLAWLIPLMMLGTAAVVIMRYGFGEGMTALQESVTYLHGTVFMLGAAYTLKHGGHVRVDIFYHRFSPRTKAWIDSVGCILFLLPLCGLILITSWDFSANAWEIREASVEPGGLPFVYLLKSLLPLMAINLAMQGIAELLRNAIILSGGELISHAD
jgi:TRAP-type mannitol/chloroaromatic compound transport system permease small subunit